MHNENSRRFSLSGLVGAQSTYRFFQVYIFRMWEELQYPPVHDTYNIAEQMALMCGIQSYLNILPMRDVRHTYPLGLLV